MGKLQSKGLKVKIMKNIRRNVRNIVLHALSEGNREAIKEQIRSFFFGYVETVTFNLLKGEWTYPWVGYLIKKCY